MKKALHTHKMQTTWLLVIVNISIVILASLVWYMLVEHYNFNSLSNLVIAVAILSALGLIMAVLQEKILSQPLEMLLRAVAHVKGDEQTETPPNPSDLKYGQEIVASAARDIYDLASNSSIASKEEQDNKFLTNILAQNGTGIIAVDREDKIVFANNIVRELFQANNGTLESTTFEMASNLTFQSSDSLKAWLADCRTNKATASKFWDRVRNTLPDGEIKQLDMVAHFAKEDAFGIELILSVTDRTDQYSVDDEQMDFVGIAAHELRGPITVIRGYLDLFKKEMDGQLDAEKIQLLERMTVSSNQLSSYIHTILNVAKIDQGTMKIYPQKTDWNKIIQESTIDLQVRAKAMDKVILYTLGDNIPQAAVDAGSIGQVITNLVDNALKYSPGGGKIVIATSIKNSMIETTIQDFGIGIPSMVVDKLFNKHYRSHRSKQGISGTGLGLFLAKSIIDAHGGSIWVNSKEGSGSTFGFTVPVYSDDHNIDNALMNSERSKHGWIKNHTMIRK